MSNIWTDTGSGGRLLKSPAICFTSEQMQRRLTVDMARGIMLQATSYVKYFLQSFHEYRILTLHDVIVENYQLFTPFKSVLAPQNHTRSLL